MPDKSKEDKQEEFRKAIKSKNIPVLTLDNKWYKLVDEIDRENARDIIERLNELIRRQGKLTTESKSIKSLKKKLMGEIMTLRDDLESSSDPGKHKELDDHTRLVEECTEKLEAYEDELLDLPRQIDEVNRELMMYTVINCYDTIKENADSISEIEEWVNMIRVELKKNLIRKQKMEQKNQFIYSYMHDIFGADVVDLFDMQFDPDEGSAERKE